MPEASVLTDDFLRELMNVGQVDILVGVPTHNDARTVGQVVQAIRAGLLKYFPRQRAVIINADGGSRDATRDLVRAASISDLQQGSSLHALRTLHSISTRYSHTPAPGTALRIILSAAELVRANACAVISPDSVNIGLEWMDRLLRPVSQDGFDLVTPTYSRHKFDGLLVRNLVYPMCRAIYSKGIREPYPPEFAFSGKLGNHFLGLNVWSEEVCQAGAEMYLIISAITGGFRLAQSYLGLKSQVDHAPADLVVAMQQTVGVIFCAMEQNPSAWNGPTEPQLVPVIGPEHEVSLEPLRINRKRQHHMFLHGVAELEPVLKVILSAPTLSEIQRAAASTEEEFCYSDDLWVRTVYEFAAAFHKSVISRGHIVQALAPLYRGKALTFLVENREASGAEVEDKTENLCCAFERLKPYLLEQWDGRK